MPEKTQIGPAVDKQLWQRFRDDVKARKGQIRGVLGNELENAIRDYLDDTPSPVEQEINARLSRLERAAGIAETDGGVLSADAETHTRAEPEPRGPPDEKPSANAATENKIRYLAECVIEEVVPSSRDLQQVPQSTLRDVVKDEYGFRSDTARRYVEELKEWFDLVDHPTADGVLVTPEEHARLIDDHRDDAEEELSDRMDELADGRTD